MIRYKYIQKRMAPKTKIDFRLVKRIKIRGAQNKQIKQVCFNQNSVNIIEVQDFRAKVFEIFGGNEFCRI